MGVSEKAALIEELKAEMMKAAQELKFEKAALIRDQIKLIKKSQK